MLETDRTTTLDPQARLAVLLATTGLTQLDLAKLLGVASRTVRRWMQGVCTPPAVAIKELEALAREGRACSRSQVRPGAILLELTTNPRRRSPSGVSSTRRKPEPALAASSSDPLLT
jgi:transcriptional regulator with XRE-family HTH domain